MSSKRNLDLLKADKNIVNEIIKTDNYIKWIETYTEKFNYFNDDIWNGNSSKISQEDRKNIDLLNKFFDQVQEYAKMNYIGPHITDYGFYYFIKYNNVVYKIGREFKIEIAYYCERTNYETLDSAIDFEFIKKNRVSNRTKNIEAKLKQLNSLIDELCHEDVPQDVILKTTNKCLTKSKIR